MTGAVAPMMGAPASVGAAQPLRPHKRSPAATSRPGPPRFGRSLPRHGPAQGRHTERFSPLMASNRTRSPSTLLAESRRDRPGWSGRTITSQSAAGDHSTHPIIRRCDFAPDWRICTRMALNGEKRVFGRAAVKLFRPVRTAGDPGQGWRPAPPLALAIRTTSITEGDR
jgi:hypothetical protein